MPCRPLDPAPATAGEVVGWVVGTAKAYADCEAKRRLLSESWPR